MLSIAPLITGPGQDCRVSLTQLVMHILYFLAYCTQELRELNDEEKEQVQVWPHVYMIVDCSLCL